MHKRGRKKQNIKEKQLRRETNPEILIQVTKFKIIALTHLMTYQYSGYSAVSDHS